PSRSHTAVMRAMSCCQMPGRSWPREMRPVPMAPTLMRLPGDVAPNTDEGTMAGKPATTEEAMTPFPAVARKRWRSIFFMGMVGSVLQWARVLALRGTSLHPGGGPGLARPLHRLLDVTVHVGTVLVGGEGDLGERAHGLQDGLRVAGQQLVADLV